MSKALYLNEELHFQCFQKEFQLINEAILPLKQHLETTASCLRQSIILSFPPPHPCLQCLGSLIKQQEERGLHRKMPTSPVLNQPRFQNQPSFCPPVRSPNRFDVKEQFHMTKLGPRISQALGPQLPHFLLPPKILQGSVILLPSQQHQEIIKLIHILIRHLITMLNPQS
jgi:hypothetical protein